LDECLRCLSETLSFWQDCFSIDAAGANLRLKTNKSGQTPASDTGPSEDAPHGDQLDRYDVAILHALQAEARLTNTELAARIGLSPAPTWRRVKWLEEQGYITGYRAEIDRRKIGLGVLAFVRVDAERNNAEATRALEAAIRSLPEVIACHYISGAGTFELHVMATDLDAYSRWSMDTLFKLPNVKDIHTSFSLGEVKAGAALPLGHLSRRK
jgi:Lrp/AsnC family transcriptional regulator, leucine-responsive regulatory protein